jgi:hypothetical protein
MVFLVEFVHLRKRMQKATWTVYLEDEHQIKMSGEEFSLNQFAVLYV